MDQAENLRRLAQKKAGQSVGVATVAVASGKGGTGKTSFCINFAIALCALGKSVMIIDADFGLSNVDVMLDAHPKYHIGHVLRGEVTLTEAVCRGHGGIWYVAGGSGADDLLNIKKEMLESISRQIAALEANLDVILFDCGAGVNEQVLQLITAADECLLVLTPEPTAITDAFVLIKSMAAKSNFPSVRFVMNRAESPLEAITVARSFKNIVRKYLFCDIAFFGHVSFDKSVIHSIKKQLPLMLAYPTSQAAKDIRQLAAHFAAVEPSRRNGLGGLLDRIVTRYGK